MEAQYAADTERISADSHGSGAGELSSSSTQEQRVLTPWVEQSWADNSACTSTTSTTDPSQNARRDSGQLPPKSSRSIYHDYDKNRRSRCFIPHWTDEYPWVEYYAEKELMFCKYCCEYQRLYDKEFSNTFVVGTGNFRLDAVKAHSNSAKHKQAALQIMGNPGMPPITTSATWRESPTSTLSSSSSTSRGFKAPQKKTPARAKGDSGPTATGRLRIGAFFDSKSATDNLPTMCPLPREPVSYPSAEGQHPQIPHDTLQNRGNTVPMSVTMRTESSSRYPPTSAHPRDDGCGRVVVGGASAQARRERAQEVLNPTAAVGGSTPGRASQTVGSSSLSSSSSSTSVPIAGSTAPRMRWVWKRGPRGAFRMETSQVDEGADDSPAENEHVDSMGMTAEGAQEEGDEITASEANLDQFEYEEGDDWNEASSDVEPEPDVEEVTDISTTSPLPPRRKPSNQPPHQGKRQRLERRESYTMVAEDEQGVYDENLVNGEVPGLGGPNGEESELDSPDQHYWMEVAERYELQYSQLMDKHNGMMTSFQKKIANLERKNANLEQRMVAMETRISRNSTKPDSSTSCPQQPPGMNMYSSVVVVQMPGKDPLTFRNDRESDFGGVQQDLARAGINISLSGSSTPSLGRSRDHCACCCAKARTDSSQTESSPQITRLTDAQAKCQREKGRAELKVASIASTTGINAAMSGTNAATSGTNAGMSCTTVQTKGAVSDIVLPVLGGVLTACDTDTISEGDVRRVTDVVASVASNNQAVHVPTSCSNVISGTKSRNAAAIPASDNALSSGSDFGNSASNSGVTKTQINSTLPSENEHTRTQCSNPGERGAVPSNNSLHSSGGCIVIEDENCSLALSCNTAAEVVHAPHDQMDQSVAEDNPVNLSPQLHWDPDFNLKVEIVDSD